MTTYQWIAVIIAVCALFGGQVLVSICTAFIVWFKTKGLVDYKLKEHGARIGACEQANKSMITSDNCQRCKEEQKVLGEILIKQNETAHDSINVNIKNLYDITGQVKQGVTALTSKFEIIEKHIINGSAK